MAVCAGLQTSSIMRLTETWEKVPSRLRVEFHKILDLCGNIANYRCLRLAIKEAKYAKEPCLPYVGMYLTEIMFIIEGNRDFLDDGRVNWLKHKMLFQTIEELFHFKYYPYPFYEPQREAIICEFLDLFEGMDEYKLFDKSLQIQPRKRRVY